MYHIQITIVDDKNECVLADVVGSCTHLSNVPRTLKTLLKTEPILSVTNGSVHAPLDLPVDDIETAQQKSHKARTSLASTTRMTNIARRNQTYVSPALHMEDFPLTIRDHANLLGYLNTMPLEIPGVANLKVEAHRKWFAWYDRGITAALFQDWLDKQRLTVRQWHADYLMARCLAHDFAGRELRMEIQRYRSGLIAGRTPLAVFDGKMTTFKAKLEKLQVPVNKPVNNNQKGP